MLKKLKKNAQILNSTRARKILKAIGSGELCPASIARATLLPLRSVDRTLKVLVQRKIITVRIVTPAKRKQAPRSFYRSAIATEADKET